MLELSTMAKGKTPTNRIIVGRKTNRFDTLSKVLFSIYTFYMSVLKLFRISLILLFLVFTSHAIGQTTFASKAELEKAANELFQKKEFAKAKSLFSQLLSQDGLNPDYNYRFGVCIMYTEADPAKPLPYIEGGANSQGVNPEAYYFLGLIYRYNYRFDQSADAFAKAKTKGMNNPAIDLDREVQISRNGRVLYNDSLLFVPAMEKEVIKSEFYRPYDFRKLKGKVIPAPPNFKTKYDEKNLTESFIYTHFEATALVYASYGEDGANGKDLYRVKKLPNGEWSLAEHLPDVINSKYDEDFAFLDEVNNTLYFASNGHNTMGGLDVYSSRFDDNTKKWSVPVNLQHPINSPFEDFLYLSDPDNESAFFTSTRQTPEGMVKVFKTLFFDPELVELTVIDGSFEDKTDSLYNYMEANVIDPQTNEVVGKYRSDAVTGKYMFILPPKVGYTLDVAPRGAKGFRFSLDVPKQDPSKTLKQNITYNKSESEGAVQLTNYFDKAGKLDTMIVSKSLALDDMTEKMPAITTQVSDKIAAKEKQMKTEELAVKKAVEEKLLAEQQAKKSEEERILAEQKAQAAEQARLDSINQTELVAAKKAEEERILTEQKAQAAEQVRLDAIAQTQLVEAKKTEEGRILAEEQANAAEKARVDAIAQTELVEAKKAEEGRILAEEQANAAEKASLDAIAQTELVAAKKAEEERILAEEQANATEQARLDAIAQTELVEAKKAEEERILAEEQANAAEKARVDAIAQTQLVAAKKTEEVRILAEEQANAAEKARVDAIAQTELVEAKKAEEGRILAEEQANATEQARVDAIAQTELVEAKKAEEERILAEEQANAAEKARVDAIAQTELVAAKKAEEERILAEEQANATEQARLDAIAQTELVAAKKAEEGRILAEEQANAAEKARLDAIAQTELVTARKAAEELQKAEQQNIDWLAKASILARMDSLKRSKEMVDLVLQKQLAEKARLANDSMEAVAAYQEELRIAQVQALREDQERQLQTEAFKLKAQQNLSNMDSLLKVQELELAALALEEKANLEKAQQSAAFEETRLLLEQQQALLNMKAAKQQSEQDAKDLAEAKRMAEEERMNKLVAQDVKAQSVDTVANLAEVKQAEEDARKAAELSVLNIKEKELAELEHKAEIEKQQKEQEAFERDLEKARVELRLAVEKQEQEEALVKEKKQAILATERARLDSLAEIESKLLIFKEREAIKTEAIVPVAAEQDSSETLTDAEIFKQTIARIEAQRKQKEEQVRLKADEEATQRIKVTEAKSFAERKAMDEALIQAKTSGDTAKVKELELAVETKKKEASAAADTGALSEKLRSDANPNVYLAEMQKAEQAIANDKKTVANKDYTLKSMPEMVQTKALEPQAVKVESSIIVKESKIDEDRRIVDEHQAIAKVEEAKLADRIKQDREALGLHDQALAEELRQAERQAVTKGKQVVQVAAPQVEKQDSVTAPAQVSEPEKEVALEVKTEVKPLEMVVESVAVVKEVEVVKEEPNVEVATPTSKVERTVVTEQKPVTTADVDTTTTKTATQVFLESVAKLEAERKAKEQQQQVVQTPEVAVAPQSEIEEPKIAPVPVAETVSSRPVAANTAGRPAALRNYSNRKPSFEAIEDNEQRLLIQRMAAEDKGRIAVQKRLENAKMTDANASSKLEQFQRSQDVMATMKPSNAREEYQPQAFNRDALRKRKGVDYHIAVALAEINLSESVTEALSAEQGVATSVASFDLSVGHYRTQMDAHAEMLFLKGIGFENSKIVVQLDGNKISLEEVKKVLFVD